MILLHEVKKKNQNGILLKIDFEKAYDKMNWHFLHQTMVMKRFGDIWCDWVIKTVRRGKVVVRINELTSPFSLTKVLCRVIPSPLFSLIWLWMTFLIWLEKPSRRACL
jgi:hypothetical protein